MADAHAKSAFVTKEYELSPRRPSSPAMKKAASTVTGKLSRSSSVVSSGSSIKEPKGKDEAPPPEVDDAEAPSTEAPEAIEPDPVDAGSESSKLRQVLGILKKSFGVKDLSSVRLSLPANLLEPVGNLEHWHYQSRPDVFAAIGDSDDPVERMLAAIRYAFTKDLKHARQGVCKPYNSALGEQFRCMWELSPAKVDPETHELICVEHLDPDKKIVDPTSNMSSSSLVSEKSYSSKRSRATKQSSSQKSSPHLTPMSTSDDASDAELAAEGKNKLNISSDASSIGSSSYAEGKSTAPTSVASGDCSMRRELQQGKMRVIFLNEQISHHPPISAFWNESVPADGKGQRVIAIGYDHLSAKFTGTSVKVFAGPTNKGIFVQLPDRGNEEYQITHPVANVAGFFRGSLYVTVSDYTYITCTNSQSGRHLRAVISYIDESWLGKPKYGLEGVVYEVASESAESYKKLKEVPDEAIVARFSGSWRGKITYSLTKDDNEHTLIDLSHLLVVPKIVRPTSKQSTWECRRFWAKVSDAIRRKEFSQATKHKQVIEQAQRDAAAAREKKGEKWTPAFFPAAISEDGKPHLTEGGEKARKEELAGENYAPEGAGEDA